MFDMCWMLYIILLFIIFKFINLLVVLILDLIYLYKSKLNKDEDLRLLYVRKDTCLCWGNEYDCWYFIPTINCAYINESLTITFQWLKIYYSHTWSCITFKDEN